MPYVLHSFGVKCDVSVCLAPKTDRHVVLRVKLHVTLVLRVKCQVLLVRRVNLHLPLVFRVKLHENLDVRVTLYVHWSLMTCNSKCVHVVYKLDGLLGAFARNINKIYTTDRKESCAPLGCYAGNIGIVSYRRFGITYRSHPQGSRIQEKACSPKPEFT
jgi:hypothetical protein